MQRKNIISDPSHSQILVMKVQVGEYCSVLLLSLPVFQNEQSPIFFTPLISKIVLKLSVVSWVRAEGCYSIALWYGWCKKMELCSLGPADIVTRSMFTNHVYLILDLWCLFITTLPVSPFSSGHSLCKMFLKHVGTRHLNSALNSAHRHKGR